MKGTLLTRAVLLGVFFIAGSSLAVAQATFCVNPALAIPDNDPLGTTFLLNVSDSGPISDIDVSLDVTHTWQGDLIFTITNPGNTTTVPLLWRAGDSDEAGAGFSADNFAAGFTLDDEAAEAYDAAPPDGWGNTADPGIADVTGSWIPYGANPAGGMGGLTDFDGQEQNGDWTIFVSDNAGGDAGTVNEVCVVVETVAGCNLNARINNPVTRPGDLLSVEISLQHNRPRTVTRSFAIEILNEDGEMLFQRSTRPLTFHQYDEVYRNPLLRIPDQLEAGKYTLVFSINGMTQGRIRKVMPFEVERDAPPFETSGKRNGQLDYTELLDGQWEAVARVADIPGTHTMVAAYPNPFNPEATFSFAVNTDQFVQAELVDMLGRVVTPLFSGNVVSGEMQTVRIDGSSLPSGMYMIRVAGETFSDVSRVTLLK